MAGDPASVIPLYQELYNRGAVPDTHKPIVEELVRRGIITGNQTGTGEATAQQLRTQGAGQIGKVGPVEAVARGIGQGLTLNWGDELYGYGANLPTLMAGDKAKYLADAAKDTEYQRQRNKGAYEQYPKTYLGSEAGGAVLPLVGSYLFAGATGGAGAPAAAATTAKAATLAERIYQGMKTGVVIGGVSGAGAAESAPEADRYTIAPNMAKDTGIGMLTGGLLGGALPPVAGAAGAVYSNLVKRPLQALASPERFAASKLAEAIRRDYPNMSGDEIRAAAATQAQNAPNSILGDVGQANTRKLVRAAVNTPNEQNSVFEKALNARAKAGAQTIEDTLIKPNFGNVGEYKQMLDKLLADRKQWADKEFNDAFTSEHGLSQKFWDLVESRPDFFGPKSPWFKQIRKDIEAEYGLTNEAPQLSSLELAHRFKTKLQDAIDWSSNPMSRLDQTGAANISQGALKKLHAQYMDALSETTGEGGKKYFEAVKKYGDEGAVARAMKAGYERGRGASSSETAELVQGMSAAEQSAYKLGLGKALQEQNLKGHYNVDRVRRDWDSPEMDAKLKAVLPSNATFGNDSAAKFGEKWVARIQETKEALNNQSALRQAAQGNSSTAGQLLAAQDAAKEAEQVSEGVKAALSASQGNLSGLLKLAEKKFDRLQTITPKAAAEILKLAQKPAASFDATTQWTMDPAIQALINQQATWAAQKPALMRAATRGLLGGATSDEGSRRQ